MTSSQTHRRAARALAALLLPAALVLAACAPEPAPSPEPTAPVETSAPDAAESPSPEATPEPEKPATPITLASATSAELCAALDASATLEQTVDSPVTKTIAFDDEVGCKAVLQRGAVIVKVLPDATAGPDSAHLDHDMGGCTDSAREDTAIDGAAVASVVCSDRRGMTALTELSANGVRAFVRLNSHPGSSIAADPVLAGIGELWRELLAAA
ncbi:hypothetical protein [Microbacterium sp. YY-01]|uniref:hypothetical protein n=1 Tax=Microbacterium sp. YY-01 TaxID=3421634 RepID=UPI003D183842